MFRGRENICNFMRQRQSYNSNIKSAKSAEATMESRSRNNTMGTDGYEFIEYAAPDPQALGALFETMGYAAIARPRHKNVTLFRQGGFNFFFYAVPVFFALGFARLHGPSVCAIAIRVQ